MKKIIFILIAMLCIGSYTTIGAANTYTKYQNSIKRSAKRSTRKFMKHKRSNTGRFYSLRTGKSICGIQSLSYQKRGQSYPIIKMN